MLKPLGLFTVADGISLSLICTLLVRYRETKKRFQVMADGDPVTYGTMLRTRDGNAIQNPMVGALNKLTAQLSRELEKFGMDPASRSQISAGPDPGDDAILRKYGVGR